MKINCDEIIKQVVSEVKTQNQNAILAQIQGKTTKTAVLTKNRKYEIREYPIPELGKQDILIKVDGCALTSADLEEYLRDCRHTVTAVFGKEGTGTIIKMGSEGLKDTTGHLLNVGDRVVTNMNYNGSEQLSYAKNRQKEGVSSGFGIVNGAKGWFSEYIIVKGGGALIRLGNVDAESALLFEPAVKVIRLVGRAIEMKKLQTDSTVVVQGCGLYGLLCIAALRSMDVTSIIAIDGIQSRMDMAKAFGASEVIDYHTDNGAEDVANRIKEKTGKLADVAFQCVADPIGRAAITCFVNEKGAICEFPMKENRGVNGIGPQFDLSGLNYISLGFWHPIAPDYVTCLDFFKKAKEMKIPVYKLVTHRFRLSQINEAHWAALRGEGFRIAIVSR